MEPLMGRPKDRESSRGLLLRMEARPLKSGGVSYRYHPIGSKPIALGRDRDAAIRQVLDLNGDNGDRGTLAELWRLYQESEDWRALADSSRTDYTQCSLHVLRVFGKMHPAAIKPPHLNRYLRVERKDAPVRANREFALLSNLLKLAVSRGGLDVNPCREVSRNRERPRPEAPEERTLAAFLAWAQGQDGSARVIAAMAEFAALVGARRMEFIRLQWPQVGDEAVRLIRGKQRGREVVDVIAMSPALADLIARLRAAAEDPRIGPVFPTFKANQPYTERGFMTMWGRLVKRAIEAGIIAKRFTFHDLRAYYATQHKLQRGALPDLHANPATTARVYDRSRESKRGAL